MDKEYIRIGDFAGLRNTTKRALRYYEQLGLLKPTMDNDGGGNYRYYHENQLVALDIIRICTSIGMNLKDLTGYFSEDGKIDFQEILNLCISQTTEKIRQLQNMEKILHEMRLCSEDCSLHKDETGGYIRSIIERRIIVRKLPFFGNYFENQRELAKLYQECDRKGIPYSYTFGIFQRFDQESPDYYIFTQVLTDQTDDPNIIVLPAGDYLCSQNSIRDINIPDCFLPVLESGETDFILSTFMLFDQTSISSPTYEKQILFRKEI